MNAPRPKTATVKKWLIFEPHEPRKGSLDFVGHTIGHVDHGAMITVWHSKDLRDKILTLLQNEVLDYVEDRDPLHELTEGQS